MERRDRESKEFRFDTQPYGASTVLRTVQLRTCSTVTGHSGEGAAARRGEAAMESSARHASRSRGLCGPGWPIGVVLRRTILLRALMPTSPPVDVHRCSSATVEVVKQASFDESSSGEVVGIDATNQSPTYGQPQIGHPGPGRRAPAHRDAEISFFHYAGS